MTLGCAAVKRVPENPPEAVTIPLLFKDVPVMSPKDIEVHATLATTNVSVV